MTHDHTRLLVAFTGAVRTSTRLIAGALLGQRRPLAGAG